MILKIFNSNRDTVDRTVAFFAGNGCKVWVETKGDNFPAYWINIEIPENSPNIFLQPRPREE